MDAAGPSPHPWAPLTATYAACHLVVDLSCIATVLGAVSHALGMSGTSAALLAILSYDLLAFCLQLPVGALLDLLGRRTAFAMASCVLVAVGILVALSPAAALCWTAVVLVAIGNAGFHCAGGIDVLEVSDGRATPPGVFIATGAAGVFLGGRLAALGALAAALASVTMLAGCVALLDRMRRGTTTPRRGAPALPAASPALLGSCALLALTVALRSHAGMVMAFPWKSDPALAVALVAGIVAGKAAGGGVADRWGIRAASVVSLAGSAALFPLSWSLPTAGVVAVFLFNFTMPVTLSSLAGLMPTSKGLAFGMASFALAIGALPALLGHRATGPWELSALAVVSLVTLLAGLALPERASARKDTG